MARVDMDVAGLFLVSVMETRNSLRFVAEPGHGDSAVNPHRGP